MKKIIYIFTPNNIEFEIIRKIIENSKHSNDLHIVRFDFSFMTKVLPDYGQSFLFVSSDRFSKIKGIFPETNIITYVRNSKPDKLVHFITGKLDEMITGEQIEPELNTENSFEYVDIQKFREFTEDAPKEAILELIEEFQAKKDIFFNELNQAILSGDCGEIREKAHKFKGVISFFHSEKMTGLLFSLQKSGEEKDLKLSERLFSEISSEIDPFINEINKLKKFL